MLSLLAHLANQEGVKLREKSFFSAFSVFSSDKSVAEIPRLVVFKFGVLADHEILTDFAALVSVRGGVFKIRMHVHSNMQYTPI